MELWIVGFGAALVEFWWVAPAAAGAGAAGVLGVRRQRSTRARRLGLTAARLELQQARSEAVEAKAAARLAAAELTRVEADRAAGRMRPADVAAARRVADAALHAKNSAAARVRVARAQVGAERAAVPARGTDPRHLPIARAMSAHDEVAARWMQYETDAARRIAFPAMSDARVPATAEFLRLDAEARRLRPESARAKTTPEQFAAYRSAVQRLQRSFEAAEQEAWRLAGHRPDDAPAAPPSITQRWTAVATEAIAWSADGIAKAVGTAASVRESRRAARDAASEEPPAETPTWPIPSRSERRRHDDSPQ